jgi:DNA-binding NtrC family response regulator
MSTANPPSLTITAVSAAADEQSLVRVRQLRTLHAPKAGRWPVAVLSKHPIEIGRLGQVSGPLGLDDREVSRLHGVVEPQPDGSWRVVDRKSRNGTYVNGARIDSAPLAHGTIVRVGKTILIYLDQEVGDDLGVLPETPRLFGRSEPMRRLRGDIAMVAPKGIPVLILGETGVGKELVAESLHELSPRIQGPFVVLDCGSIPANLIESELFGHERGAFTGATSSYVGAFERAHEGTVFLDEIGELPLALQPKLLRVLESREVRRIGSSKTVQVNIRVVAATNRDLGVEVNRGRFREDLFYRLAVARVHVPPLRERKDDIPLLIEHILTSTPGGENAYIAPDTIDLMMKHDWPGNVRELRNVIERAVLLSETPAHDSLRRTATPGPGPGMRADVEINDDDVSNPSVTASQPGAVMTVPVDVTVPFKTAKQDVVTEFERRYISKLLEQHDGNISAAARTAGIDRMSIHKILNRLELDKPGRS